MICKCVRNIGVGIKECGVVTAGMGMPDLMDGPTLKHGKETISVTPVDSEGCCRISEDLW